MCGKTFREDDKYHPDEDEIVPLDWRSRWKKRKKVKGQKGERKKLLDALEEHNDGYPSYDDESDRLRDSC